MRKHLIFLICMMAVLLALPVFANTPLVVDEADILSFEEEQALEEKASELSDTYEMDVVILTVDELDGQRSDRYAQNYYEENLYGVGSSYDGILFLLSMEERDWAMITCGNARYVLTDYGIQSIFSEISWYLSEDEYYDAFDCWLVNLEYYFEAYEDGEPIDGSIGGYNGPGSYEPIWGEDAAYYNEDTNRDNTVSPLFISIVIGCVAALVVLLIMRSQMNTAKAQRSASTYLDESSYQLRLHRDVFLYSSISKVRRAENNSGGHSGGGRSFGGGRGKF